MENLNLVLPEIFISLAIMFLLILGIFKKDSSKLIHNFSLIILLTRKWYWIKTICLALKCLIQKILFGLFLKIASFKKMSQFSPSKMWRLLKDYSLGRWFFARAVCMRVPYFSSISPYFIDYNPEFVKVGMKKNRKITNHLGTIHVIAIANLCS